MIVQDHEGRVVAHTFRRGVPRDLLRTGLGPGQTAGQVQVLDSSEGRIVDGTFPILGGRTGTLRIGLSDGAVFASTATLTRSVVWVLALCVSIGAALTLLLTHALTEPLRRLARATLRIREGDFAARADVASRDEIGQLAGEFDRMAEALERLCRRRAVRMVYVTPLHQYPTTVTLPVARRLALYAVAARHGVPILEDDYDHEYHYRCQPLAPLAAGDPAGLVIYASTLSKVLYPSARLGFLGLPSPLVGPLTRLKRITSRQNDSVLQEALSRWMAAGGMERHLRRTRRAYAERLATLIGCIEAARARGVALEARVPDGGMAVWVRTPWDSARAASAAPAAGVFVHAEGDFRLDGAPGRHLRLGFAGLTPSEIARGMERLVSACESLPAVCQEPVGASFRPTARLPARRALEPAATCRSAGRTLPALTRISGA